MKTVVVIGASGEIGKHICTKFYKRGYNVIAGYCSNNVTNLADKLNYKKNRLCPLFIDLQNEQSIEQFFINTISIFGRIDVLVNCAGVSFPNLLIDTDFLQVKKEIDVNLLGVISACKHAVKNMLNGCGGRIINIASIWGVVGGAMETTYSATKAGLIGFSKALAKEVGSANITVNCISPGAVKSKMNAHLNKTDYEEIKSNTPLGKIITAKEVANCAVFLASNSAQNITGQNIVIDGGFTL